MAYGQWNASYNIPFGPMSFGAPGWSFVSNVTTIINPTLTNEFVFGSSRNDLHITPLTDAFNASKVGVSYKMPFPMRTRCGWCRTGISAACRTPPRWISRERRS